MTNFKPWNIVELEIMLRTCDLRRKAFHPRFGIRMNPPLAKRGRQESFKFASTHLYAWVERGAVRMTCLAQERNTMSPARAQTRTTRSGNKRTDREATAPPRDQHLQTFLKIMKRQRETGMQPRHTVQHYVQQNCTLRLQPWFNFTILHHKFCVRFCA